MLTHHTTSLPARRACVSRSRVHSLRRMMFRCAGYTRSGTARAGGEVTHPLQWSSEIYDADIALVYYKTPDGCKGGWTCAKHAPGGREAVGRLRVKTADGCKAGWTRDDRHAPRRGEDSMGRVRINFRYYNPADGRWTRRVPIGVIHIAKDTLYVYADNRPIEYSDIIGLFGNSSQMQPTFVTVDSIYEPPKNDNKNICGGCSNYLREQLSLHLEVIKNYYNRPNCKLKTYCEPYIQGQENRRVKGEFKPVYSDTTYGLIRVSCCNLIEAKERNTFVHELQHYKDWCDGLFDYDKGCLGLVCTELRAYKIALFPSYNVDPNNKEEVQKFKALLLKEAMKSMMENCRDKLEKSEIEPAVYKEAEEVFKKCIFDIKI